MFFEILIVLLSFGSILFLAYVTSRYIARKSNMGAQGKHLKIIESVSLGIDKRLCLLKAGENYVLIAVSGKKVDFLCNIDLKTDEVENEKPGEQYKTFDFKKLLEKYLSKSDSSAKSIEQEPEESLLRNNLNRLRGITRQAGKGYKNEDEGIDEG
jgi:flagellar protein FliO/FliZ